jgi:hypothetical protein
MQFMHARAAKTHRPVARAPQSEGEDSGDGAGNGARP